MASESSSDESMDVELPRKRAAEADEAALHKRARTAVGSQA